MEKEFKQEVNRIVQKSKPRDGNWEPGDAPSIVFNWAVQALAKAGKLSIIGVYPPTARTFPIGEAMGKNLTFRMGNCNHRKYIPILIEMVRNRTVNPSEILTHVGPLTGAIDAYQNFDKRQPGWVKVKLEPAVPSTRVA